MGALGCFPTTKGQGESTCFCYSRIHPTTVYRRAPAVGSCLAGEGGVCGHRGDGAGDPGAYQAVRRLSTDNMSPRLSPPACLLSTPGWREWTPVFATAWLQSLPRSCWVQRRHQVETWGGVAVLGGSKSISQPLFMPLDVGQLPRRWSSSPCDETLIEVTFFKQNSETPSLVLSNYVPTLLIHPHSRNKASWGPPAKEGKDKSAALRGRKGWKNLNTKTPYRGAWVA